MAKPPAFQFYARDWVSDGKVKLLSLEAQGAYLRLLSYQWIEGQLPLSCHSIATLTDIHPRSMSRLWPVLEEFFPILVGDTGRANPRLWEQAKEVEDRRLAMSEGGKKSAEGRQGAFNQPPKHLTQAPSQGSSNTASASASATAVQERTVENPEYPPWVAAVLDDWISVCPLPKAAKPEKCHKTIHDLQKIDGHAADHVAAVCAYIVRNKAPTYIKSPMKLRQLNGAKDCQTFEMYATEMVNHGNGKVAGLSEPDPHRYQPRDCASKYVQSMQEDAQ